MPTVQEFARYLEAKRSVDDRALDRNVLGRLRNELGPDASPTMVDVGAGIGTGLERLLDWGIVTDPDYTGVDENAELVRLAKERLPETAQLAASTLAAFASDTWNVGRFDLVVAHAFLDIVDLVPSLTSLVDLARPGALLYFPITFDGETVFEPSHPDDEPILSRYHLAMCEVGNSGTGRLLFHALEAQPAEVLAMGSSDWIVHPVAAGYPNDEAYFLRFVVGMVERTIGHDAHRWARDRYRQIEASQLVYVAHQIDCLARKNAQ